MCIRDSKKLGMLIVQDQVWNRVTINRAQHKATRYYMDAVSYTHLIEYVFHAMKECPSNIRNIRAYLLTTLYNAPATMDNFYSAKVNHDFNGW